MTDPTTSPGKTPTEPATGPAAHPLNGKSWWRNSNPALSEWRPFTHVMSFENCQRLFTRKPKPGQPFRPSQTRNAISTAGRSRVPRPSAA